MTDRSGYERALSDYEGFLRETPFGELFRDAEPASPLLGWHHPLRTYRAADGGELLLTGDAAGSLYPCLGLGVSMALLTAGMAAEAAFAMLQHRDDPAARAAAARHYRRANGALFRHYRVFDYIFRLMVSSGTRSGILLWGMKNWPGTADSILGIIAERHPWRTFSWRSLFFPRRGRA